MRPLAKKALEAMEKQFGGRVINRDLIDATLKEIGKEYRPGLIRWIREQPGQWARLLELEETINRAALTKDEKGLTLALSDYRKFFHNLMPAYQRQGENLFLFK